MRSSVAVQKSASFLPYRKAGARPRVKLGAGFFRDIRQRSRPDDEGPGEPAIALPRLRGMDEKRIARICGLGLGGLLLCSLVLNALAF
jgi:hypothetical protein